jgi:hypothetical protein
LVIQNPPKESASNRWSVWRVKLLNTELPPPFLSGDLDHGESINHVNQLLAFCFFRFDLSRDGILKFFLHLLTYFHWHCCDGAAHSLSEAQTLSEFVKACSF